MDYTIDDLEKIAEFAKIVPLLEQDIISNNKSINILLKTLSMIDFIDIQNYDWFKDERYNNKIKGCLHYMNNIVKAIEIDNNAKSDPIIRSIYGNWDDICKKFDI